MDHDQLDNEELMFVALDAVNNGRYGEGLSVLKTLLQREPDHANARYLLAAQHAQLGMFERAEIGFRALLETSPGFTVARFQLGQLLLMREAMAEAKAVLSPLVVGDDALAAYARALCAFADGEHPTVLRELDEGLRLPQTVPTLATDMQALRARLTEAGAPPSTHHDPAQGGPVQDGVAPSARLLMSGYGRGS